MLNELTLGDFFFNYRVIFFIRYILFQCCCSIIAGNFVSELNRYLNEI